DRRVDAERTVVAALGDAVAIVDGDRLVAELPAIPAARHGDARHQLVLAADRVLPVVAALGPALENRWIGGERRRDVLAERRRVDRRGELGEIQIAGRVERRAVAVEIAPRARVAQADRRLGVVVVDGAAGGEADARDVAGDAGLDGGLAGAEEVVGDADAR